MNQVSKHYQSYRLILLVFFLVFLSAASFARFYIPPAKPEPFNTLAFKNFSVNNILDFEPAQGKVPASRWAFGPCAGLRFELDQDKLLKATLSFSSPIPNQHITIVANGRLLLDISLQEPHQWPDERQSVDVRFQGAAGMNELLLNFTQWNGNGFVLSEIDRRPFALHLLQLTFTEEEVVQ